MAHMVHRGLMSFAEYMDNVMKRMDHKLWLAYELKDGKPIAVVMSKPSKDHIILDTWEFTILVQTLPLVDRMLVRKDDGSETNIVANEEPASPVA